LDISPVWTPVITAEVKKTTIPSSADWAGKLMFFMLVPYGEFIFLIVTSVLIVLWCKASYV
jgi:hypothetical protein